MVTGHGDGLLRSIWAVIRINVQQHTGEGKIQRIIRFISKGSKYSGGQRMKTKHKSLSKLKKEVWAVFSQYIRLRDCLKTTGTKTHGLCVTCGRRYAFSQLHAGHFISGRHNSVLFSERGVHAQCFNCNITLRGATLEYRRKIIEMYGKGFDEALEKVARMTIRYTAADLEEMKLLYKAKIKELENA